MYHLLRTRRGFLHATLCAIAALVLSGGIAASSLYAKGGEVRLRTRLAGAAIQGLVPSGQADYRAGQNQRRFSVEVEDVRLPDGTQLTIQVNGNSVGTVALSGGFADLNLDSRFGQSVPNVSGGAVIVVLGPNGPILSGVM